MNPAPDASALKEIVLREGVSSEQYAAVHAVLKGQSDGSQFLFWTQPKSSLSAPGQTVDGVLVGDGSHRTPLQALRDGDCEKVLSAAHGFVGR